MALLEIDRLTVRFGGLRAVDQFDLRLEEGEVFSVIGPNGAGKTTVFNAVTGLCEPTGGVVRFAGRVPRRPLTVRLVLLWLLLGALTGSVAAVLAVNPDQLWRAAVKRPQAGGFTWAAAWRGAVGHFRGALVVEKNPRNGMHSVGTGTGQPLAVVRDAAEAERLRAAFEQAIARGRLGDVPAEQRERLAAFARERSARSRLVWLAFGLGLVVGPAGAFAVWRRSRGTPDVIAGSGIARTFQNIRLFPELSVLDNVLVGADRSARVGLVSALLRTPGFRREQYAAVEEARQLLAFVGLQGKEDRPARDLPYGDRRLLEVARALATRPRLLLLDEPAAGMNPTETAELMGLILRIRARGVTVLLIEHHMQLVMGISDRIAVLDHGVKIAEGTPTEVRADPRVIEAYLGKEEVA